jgi:transposase
MGCEGCWEKQQKIDRLTERIEELEGKLAYQRRKESEGYFGSSTPSSKKPFKKNSTTQTGSKNGGAREGHPGHGRASVSGEEAESVDYADTPSACPYCGGELESKGFRDRSIIDTDSGRAKKKIVKCALGRCKRCGKTTRGRPAALPKSLYGNMLTAQACLRHFLHGMPVGKLEEQWNGLVKNGVLFKIFQRVSAYWLPAYEKLIEEYRQAAVRHADETGWRTDGDSGYAWIFCTPDISIFQFKSTRSSEVPKQVFGTAPLDGTLVVDRYNGYNKLPVNIQYCYAHLLRAVEDLGKEFELDEEVQRFVLSFAPLLSEAMRLHSAPFATDEDYYRHAHRLRDQILEVVNAEAVHLGIRNIQEIFRRQEKRLYHWAFDRRVPAHNNRAERDLRCTVIARKVSFGSQSAAGAKARSVLMTILHTARKRLPGGDLESWFKEALDTIAWDPSVDTYTLSCFLRIPLYRGSTDGKS